MPVLLDFKTTSKTSDENFQRNNSDTIMGSCCNSDVLSIN